MLEIVFYGRAGQGSKSAASILADVSLEQGKFIQTFPEYGAARAGAPMRVFLRIDDKHVRRNVPIDHPDIIIVTDISMMSYDYVYNGLKEDSIIIANSDVEPAYLREKYNFKGRIFWLNATKLALDITGKNVTNTAMLGAFAKSIDFVEHDVVKKVFDQYFGKKLSPEIMQKNFELMDKSYEATKEC